MSTIEAEIDGQLGDSQRLSKLLDRVAELQSDKEKIDAEAKIIGKKLREAEQLAVEALGASGLDGVRASGKSWFVREFFSVNIPSENKERIVEIASEACPELVGVNTASLKSWLMERRRDAEVDGGLASGTPFEGLISEYREMRLSHRTLG
jgi:hypothetical protein